MGCSANWQTNELTDKETPVKLKKYEVKLKKSKYQKLKYEWGMVLIQLCSCSSSAAIIMVPPLLAFANYEVRNETQV